MAKPSLLTQQQRDQIVELATEGLAYPAISGLLGIPTSTVHYHARRAGIERGQGRPPTVQRPRHVTSFDAARPDTTWWDDAACAGMDVNVFYPPKGDQDATRYARSVCAACPVRHACLADALTRPFEHGIWGGLTGRDRTELTARNTARTA